MKIIKRNGMEVDFDINKIIVAITKANNTVPSNFRLSEDTINSIAKNVENECIKRNHEMNVENIQDMVESELVHTGSYQIAKNYITYRYTHQVNREGSELDKKILSIVDLANEEVKQENSNKDPVINSTQRDYIAGEVSRDITMRLLVDPDIREAHDKGIIHFHDSDYFIQHMHNCFTGDTEFIVNGCEARRFDEFKDGDEVAVISSDGVIRMATVHTYGYHHMIQVTLVSSENLYVSFRCTQNHRWILKDGTVTTNISVGDELLPSTLYENISWKVVAINDNSDNLELAWCVEEPVTHSFTLKNYIVTGNCDLVNLEDILQNGTVISDTLIEKPHSFSTACNITTQVVAQVASNQLGMKCV